MQLVDAFIECGQLKRRSSQAISGTAGGKVLKVRHMNEQDSNPKTRRVVPAPPPSNPGLYSTVLSVECAEDEEIEWQWTETPEGRVVSGYRLVPRLAKPRTFGS